MTHGIGRGVFKSMLIYFDHETGADKQKIALQKDVSRDLRDYLDIEKSIIDIILGGIQMKDNHDSKKTKSVKAEEFDDIATDKKGDLSHLDDTKQELVTQHPEEGLTTDGEKNKFHTAMDNIQAYNIVKDMLVNNSLPINKGNVDEAVITRKLILDKKIMLNLLIDL